MVSFNSGLIGKDDMIVSEFSDDFYAKEGCLTWTEDISILKRLMAKQCSLAIITDIKVNDDIENKNIIFCSNPLRLFEKIVDKCFSWPKTELIIGNNSIVHDNVSIGKNVCIGDNCRIGPNVVIGDNVTIGCNVEIGSFSTIGNSPYYILLDKNNRTRNRKIYGCTIIRDNVHIGSYCSVDNGITTETVIGIGCRIGNYVEIGHDVKMGNNCCICAQTAIGGFVTIGNDCVFWGRSGVSNRITIASRTTLLASSILTKSVFKDGQILCGFPAVPRIEHWKKVIQK